MSRIRMESIAIRSWDDADDTLRQLAEIERDLALIEGDANHTIDEAKAKAKEDSAPLLARKAGLATELQRFCEAHRADLGKAKSRRLNFGAISWRESSRLLVPDEAATITRLRAVGLDHCIKVAESLIKKAVAKLTDDQRRTVGVGVETVDVFGYEVDVTKIEEAA